MKTAKVIVGLVLLTQAFALAAEPIVIGSKNFNESYILGEVMAQLLEAEGYEVERKFNLGGTKVAYEALLKGGLDVYAEYTGTLQKVVYQVENDLSVDDLREIGRPLGITMLDPFGFNNSYAMATTKTVAGDRSLKTISDLVPHSDLRVFVTHEFVDRADGWPGLMEVYGFKWRPKGIEHAIAYRAMDEGRVDVTDAYTTDGEIERYDLHLLEDDKRFFPKYYAAPLARIDLGPDVLAILNRAAGTIPDNAMVKLNADVIFRGLSTFEAAQKHLKTLSIESGAEEISTGYEIWEKALEHLALTLTALISATIFAIVLSLTVFSITWLARPITYFAGLLQTIPSIALLALMVPIFDIGFTPAVVALFLYSLLPIIRNSITALSTIDPILLRVAEGAGFTKFGMIWHVNIPLALPAILAGIRVSAVICIGTATLAAFIGAGGLGDFIVQGLALNNMTMVLIGAGTAAGLAIVVELIFEGIESFVLPGYLKALKSSDN